VIGRLAGRIVECEPGLLVLDVGGVGYEVRIPLSTFYVLASRPDPALLHVHTHVREDALHLYGFATRDERTAFERLIGISGVGPKMALAVLSGIGVADLLGAVRHGDRARLERIPGIGRKTAERILLELREKANEPHAPPALPDRSGGENGALRDDAVSALLNLGYAREAAQRAVTSVLSEGPAPSDIGAVLRGALRRLVR
jgi:Holliday junction DNA helicase RuvA